MFDPDATVIRPQAKPEDPDATVIRCRLLPTVVPPPNAPPLPQATALALQPGFRLHEYRIDGVLGQGGFGITYLATDVHLNAAVAIKEYLPEEIAFRAGDRSVSPNASAHRDRYRQGLESFLVEARTLASFRHPAIVRVARFFEAHRTAYMVLEYERGSPFKVWWPLHKQVGEAGLIELLLPLLDGLAAVHTTGFLHRDIKPDNIQVRAADGGLVLLDFGSAGQAVAVADEGGAALTPGYAPIEQYGAGRQGPWTDLYALGATLYWAVAGKKPPDAEQRALDPACFTSAADAGRGRFGENFLKAIDWALHTDATQRPQTVAELRRALCTDHLSRIDLRQALQHDNSQFDSSHDNGEPHERWRQRWLDRWRGRWRPRLHPRHWPLAFKLTLAMLATAMLPMLLTGVYNLQGSQAAVAAAELRFVEQLAHSTAARLAQFVADHGHFAAALASEPALAAALADSDSDRLSALNIRLARLVRGDPDLQLMLLLDDKGRAHAASDPALVGRNYAFRQYFSQAMAGRPFTTGLSVGADGVASLFVAEPLRRVDGAVVGALVLRVRGTSVVAILDEVRHDSELTPFLVDGDGVLVHHPQQGLLYRSLRPLAPQVLAQIRADQRYRRDDVESLGETELAQAMVGAVRTGNVSYRSALDGQAHVAGFAPVPGLDWVVGVSEARATFEAPLRTLAQHLLWSLGLVGLLFTGLALRFARSIVKPVRELTSATQALKAGDYDTARVVVSSRDELGQLGRTFNVMIDVLRQRDREQRRRSP